MSCVSDCFWSSDTATDVVCGAFFGTIIGLFIGCLVDGSIGFTDGGFTCAANIIADLWGFWAVGAAIGIVIGGLVAYVNCQQTCATAAAAGDTTAQQGLDSTDPGSEPKDCATARSQHASAVKAGENARSKAASLRQVLQSAERSLKRSRLFSYLGYVLAAVGAARKPWLLVAAVAVVLPAASLYRSRKQQAANEALAAYAKMAAAAGIFEGRAGWLQGIVSRLCH